MSPTPLHHMVRVRRSEDLVFVRNGLMDEVVVNANQLENSAESVAAAIRETTLPFSVDPVLWRFQVPEWWRNEAGETKRNYRRLAAAYSQGTTVQMDAGPLVELVCDDAEWKTLGRNVVAYQAERLRAPTQVDMLEPNRSRELKPSRIIAPGLVAYSALVDRINRLLLDESATEAGTGVAAQVIVPRARLMDKGELENLLQAVPTDGVSSYLIWTVDVTEDELLSDSDLLYALVRLINDLAGRGLPVAHQYGNYGIAALHDVGLSGLVHHLGWVDKGDRPQQPNLMIRSCQTYAPVVHHSIRFNRAANIAGHLNQTAYGARYCNCTFCMGAFDHGQHPLDLLLEDQRVNQSNGKTRRTPTSRAVTANTWHYLWNRRMEMQAFAHAPGVEVIERDIERATELANDRETDRLSHLATMLRSA